MQAILFSEFVIGDYGHYDFRIYDPVLFPLEASRLGERLTVFTSEVSYRDWRYRESTRLTR
jgi:hypothetical protein